MRHREIVTTSSGRDIRTACTVETKNVRPRVRVRVRVRVRDRVMVMVGVMVMVRVRARTWVGRTTTVQCPDSAAKASI